MDSEKDVLHVLADDMDPGWFTDLSAVETYLSKWWEFAEWEETEWTESLSSSSP